ncbi:integrase core domain-containing protein, partial [Anaerorhabdus sp.]|uniref:integrase core domain-containing protein n=1 Tax=Anaerorhabdus sp. TaxID=1872524 RepID=UPI002B206A5E
GLIVHTDQGSQYTGVAFRSIVENNGGNISNSRKGNPYDNAIMESFYRTLKRELIDDAHYVHRQQAQQEIFKYIEIYYNTKRMHSALNFQTPLQFEKNTTSIN